MSQPISIGAASIDPLQEAAPAAGISRGAGIWFVVSALIALFVGGWVSGRMSGAYRREDTTLHGLLSWGLAMLATTYLVGTTIGGVVSGATGLLGKGLASLGSGAAALTSNLTQEATAELRGRGLGLDDLKREALALLRDTGKPELDPGQLGAAGERLGDEARSTAAQAAKTPESADLEVRALLDLISERGGDALQAADRDAAINVLVHRSKMTPDEADRTIAQWEAMFQKAQAQLAALKDEAEAKAREAGDKLANGIARTAGWSALAMILGGAAAACGGLLGAPRRYRLGHEIGFGQDPSIPRVQD